MPRNPESFQRNPEESFDKDKNEFKESEHLKKDKFIERFNRTEQAVSFRLGKLIEDKKWDEAVTETFKGSKDYQSYFLKKILLSAVRAGAFDEAKKIADNFEGHERLPRLLFVGESKARAGLADEARVLFDEVKQLVKKENDKINRLSGLRYLGLAQIESSMLDDAKQTVQDLYLLDAGDNGYFREVCSQIAIAEAESGQIESAKEYAAKIERIKGSGDDRVYEAIVDAELSAGLTDDAKKTAKEIYDHKRQSRAESKIRSKEEDAKKLRHGPYR